MKKTITSLFFPVNGHFPQLTTAQPESSMSEPIQHAKPVVQLLPGREKRLESGHSWIFSNELATVSPVPPPGSVVTVQTSRGRLAGTGFYHPHSLIAVRLLSRSSIHVDHAFFEERLATAFELREQTVTGTNAVRLVHSESDQLPGLVIDRYERVLCLQVVSAGMELQLPTLIDTLIKLQNPELIILRNDHHLREREGLPQTKGIVYNAHDAEASRHAIAHADAGALAQDVQQIAQITLQEHGLYYQINALEGQKTGFYIDQRDHRAMFAKFVREGDRVLDAFCYHGAFAMHAAKAGASEVTAMDVARPACDQARANVTLNHLQNKINVVQADVMQVLPAQSDTSDKLDVINLDPPNFAPNRKSVGPALRAYRKLHRAAIRQLRAGGILATATCSHHITGEAFLNTVQRAANDTGNRVQMLFRGAHPPDHPVDPAMAETEYLKFFIFRILPR